MKFRVQAFLSRFLPSTTILYLFIELLKMKSFS